MGNKKELETKNVGSCSTSVDYAKRVITGDIDTLIDKDKIIYTYDRVNNILTLKDSFSETKYQPLFVDDNIFPFNKRIRPEEL